MTTTDKKTIKIPLSDRAPVTVDPDAWPVIASAETWNGQHKSQANYVRKIIVREHDDGRRLVYGSLDSGNGGAPITFRSKFGGYLIDEATRLWISDRSAADKASEAATIRAIRRVAGLIEDPQLADECIADLPPTEI